MISRNILSPAGNLRQAQNVVLNVVNWLRRIDFSKWLVRAYRRAYYLQILSESAADSCGWESQSCGQSDLGCHLEAGVQAARIWEKTCDETVPTESLLTSQPRASVQRVGSDTPGARMVCVSDANVRSSCRTGETD